MKGYRIHVPRTVHRHTGRERGTAARRRRRGILAVLLGLTVVSLGAGMFSLALFTDQTTVSGSFATGTWI